MIFSKGPRVASLRFRCKDGLWAAGPAEREVHIMQPVYIAALAFASAVLLVLGLYRPRIVDYQEYSRRMAKILHKKNEAAGTGGGRGIKRITGRLYGLLKNMMSVTPLRRWAERELTKADLPLRGEEFLAFSVTVMGAAVLFTLLATGSWTAALVVMVVMLPAPSLFLRWAKQKRLARINDQIGDALVIIANSLRSGFSFLQAMDLVRKEMPDPIAREFGRTFQEINLGTPTERALENMVERVGSDDLEMVVAAVLIQRQVGGNLAEVLDKIAHTVKERIRIKREIKTLTAQGRISGVIIGLLPVALALFLLVISPQYMALLFQSRAGLLMVGAALLAQTTGFLLIRRIVDIKY